MNPSISYWQVAGFLFTAILGTFLHFLFDISGQNMIAALFSAVNESIWEHMKLIYYPMLLFALMENRFWGKKCKQFWCVKLVGMILALILIPVSYYTYTGVLGVSSHWVNITIFFLAAGSAFWLETIRFQQKQACRLHSRTAFVLMCMIGILFTVLTFFPPQIPFFKDPITGSYGFQG